MIRIFTLLTLSILFTSCNNSIPVEKFTFSTWTNSGGEFNEKNWIKKLSYYDSLGISEILVGGNPDVIEKIVQ